MMVDNCAQSILWRPPFPLCDKIASHGTCGCIRQKSCLWFDHELWWAYFEWANQVKEEMLA